MAKTTIPKRRHSGKNVVKTSLPASRFIVLPVFVSQRAEDSKASFSS
jgi:hypothetical protein